MSQEAVATKTQPLNKRLEVFIGEWREEGRTFQSPFTPEAKVSSLQTWEWLPGEQFIIHRLSGRLGDNDIALSKLLDLIPRTRTMVCTRSTTTAVRIAGNSVSATALGHSQGTGRKKERQRRCAVRPSSQLAAKR